MRSASPQRLLGVVGGVQGGRAGGAPAGHQLLEEHPSYVGVQMGGRLVEQVQRGLPGQRPGEAHPLLFTAGQLRRAPVRRTRRCAAGQDSWASGRAAVRPARAGGSGRRPCPARSGAATMRSSGTPSRRRGAPGLVSGSGDPTVPGQPDVPGTGRVEPGDRVQRAWTFRSRRAPGAPPPLRAATLGRHRKVRVRRTRRTVPQLSASVSRGRGSAAIGRLHSYGGRVTVQPPDRPRRHEHSGQRDHRRQEYGLGRRSDRPGRAPHCSALPRRGSRCPGRKQADMVTSCSAVRKHTSQATRSAGTRGRRTTVRRATGSEAPLIREAASSSGGNRSRAPEIGRCANAHSLAR